jgi:hypothetical protein
MVAAKPRLLTPVGYPNILHECVNAVYANMCTRSLDGGLTWSPPTMSFPNENLPCGAFTGHLAAAPDGTLYLPTSLCGEDPVVYVSRDDGLTWTKRVVASADVNGTDPTVGIDSEGNAYVAYVDTKGTLFLSVSKDAGATWSTPVVASAPGITGSMPAIAVGDPGRVAIAYPGTDDLPNGFATDPLPPRSEEAWYPYFTVSFDALDENPTFESFSASGDDPLERGHACQNGGRCGYQVDFIDAVIGPDGLPYASFADGCTSPACLTNPGANNNEGGTGKGIVATVVKSPMKWCEERCSKYGPAPS